MPLFVISQIPYELGNLKVILFDYDDMQRHRKVLLNVIGNFHLRVNGQIYFCSVLIYYLKTKHQKT